MFHKKITRKEFLKTGVLGLLIGFFLPVLKLFKTRDNVSYKDAKYYKNLAG